MKKEIIRNSRQMFCIKDGELKIAPVGLEQSHFEWFTSEGWIDESTADEFFKKTIRGFYFPQTNTLYSYTGNQGFYFNDETISNLKKYLPELKNKMELNSDTNICFGPRNKLTVGIEWPQLCIGKLGEWIDLV